MNFKEYQKLAERTCVELNNEVLNDFHMLSGMTTEIGETLDCFKKQVAYNKKIDWINVQEELGDLMWYVANFCRMHNFDMDKILQNNIDKLKIRYPEKFNEENAINRNLKAERKELEK